MNREAGKKDRYVTASAAIYSIETDCSFLSASYLINNIGQEYGLTYNFTDVDTNTGTNMYNQDWDIEF